MATGLSHAAAVAARPLDDVYSVAWQGEGRDWCGHLNARDRGVCSDGRRVGELARAAGVVRRADNDVLVRKSSPSRRVGWAARRPPRWRPTDGGVVLAGAWRL